jgi:cysteine-rich repeat protein
MLCQGVNCDDSNECTDDACDPLNGQCGNDPVPDGTGCNFVGFPGLCMSGVCQDAMLCQGVNCDDSNQCTDDACDPEDGSCGSTPVADGTACDFGGLPGICGGGTCQDAMLCQGVNCNDSNPCTDDACDPQDGLCDNTPVPDGTGCNFGGLPGLCMSGLCEDAMLCQGVVCDDTNDCTADSCDPQDGLCDFTNEPSGASCNAGGGPGSGMCNGAGTCNASPACGDGNLDPSELCDDGNTNNGDGCAGDCTWEPISAAFNVCCNIDAPINVGLADISVDATVLPLTQVVAGQQASVSIDGTVDTSGIPVGINATLVQPSTFTLGGTVGSSSSQTFPLPTPQVFNPGSNPIVQLGMHQFLGNIDQGANQVCVDVTDTVVTATIFGSTNTYACTPGTCAGAANTPVCVEVSP